jgi:putative membrane protein
VRPGDLLDAEARARLESAVAEAERATGGEIVVAVVRACDEYASAAWALGASFAALALLALGLFAPPLPWVAYLAAQAAALAAGHALARLGGVRRLLLPAERVEREVAERAARCFAEQGLTRTRGRSGILIFVTILERRVVVLADAGVDCALAPGESWQAVVDLVVDGLHRGAAAQGLEAAVRRCGEILARRLPAAAPNPDELPNAVVLEE